MVSGLGSYLWDEPWVLGIQSHHKSLSLGHFPDIPILPLILAIHILLKSSFKVIWRLTVWRCHLTYFILTVTSTNLWCSSVLLEEWQRLLNDFPRFECPEKCFCKVNYFLIFFTFKVGLQRKPNKKNGRTYFFEHAV